MHSSRFISSVLNGKWAIEPGFALTQGPIIANMLNQYVTFEKQEPDKMTAFAVSPVAAARGVKYSYWDGFDRAPSGSVAVVRLKGVLMKDDQYCGPAGMATIGEVIKAASTHKNIEGIVLHIDSPGSTVDGIEPLGNTIAAVEKPVVTFVDGMMASGAFWAGSHADEIIASTDTDEIGSVGVKLSFMDVQPYYESLGIVFRTLNASTSPDKNTLFEGIRKGDKKAIEQYTEEVLDVLDEKFMNIIRKNLPGAKEEHLTGKVFFARDLMGSIVNSIGTLDDAINRVAELAKEKRDANGNGGQASSNQQEETATEQQGTNTSNEVSDNQNSKFIQMKQYAHVNSALGVESLEAVDEVVSLNDEQLEALDTALGANNSEELQTQLDAANETIGTHTATISEHVASIAGRDATIAERDAEIARLKGKASNSTATAKTEGDDQDLEKGKEKTVVSEGDDFETAVKKVSEEYLIKH